MVSSRLFARRKSAFFEARLTFSVVQAPRIAFCLTSAWQISTLTTPVRILPSRAAPSVRGHLDFSRIRQFLFDARRRKAKGSLSLLVVLLGCGLWALARFLWHRPHPSYGCRQVRGEHPWFDSPASPLGSRTRSSASKPKARSSDVSTSRRSSIAAMSQTACRRPRSSRARSSARISTRSPSASAP